MEYKNQFETKWAKSADELPKIGSFCPLCEQGEIQENSFTDKKGQKWQSVKCPACKVKWMFKVGGSTGGVKGNEIILEEIRAGFKKVFEDLIIINDNVKVAIKLLKKE
jgi:hypothetical protein